MIDQPFRNILPRYTNSLVDLYKRLGLTPNQITLGGLVLACMAAFATAHGWVWLALAIWWGGRLFDGTDGIYARATDQTSEFGAFFDILCDMASYSVMIFGFASLYPELQGSWMIMLFFYVLCITGALSLGAIEQKLALESKDNRGIRLAAGLAEGGETGIAYSLFLLFPSQIKVLSTLWILVLFVTVLARALLAYKILKPVDRKD
jgi:phosphatidylglycerophosphate synthase